MDTSSTQTKRVFEKFLSDHGDLNESSFNDIVTWLLDSKLAKNEEDCKKIIRELINNKYIIKVNNSDDDIVDIYSWNRELKNKADSNDDSLNDDKNQNNDLSDYVLRARSVSELPQKAKKKKSKSKLKDKKEVKTDHKRHCKFPESSESQQSEDTPEDIESIFSTLLEAVQVIAHDLRRRLNSVDYLNLISSITIEYSEKIGIQTDTSDKNRSNLKSSKIKKAIESDLDSFDNFLELMKLEFSSRKDKKLLNALISMKNKLEAQLTTDHIDLYENEEIEWKGTDVCNTNDDRDDYGGKVYLTNYRFVFIDSNDKVISFPLSYIISVSKLSEKKYGGSKNKSIEVITKDQRIFRFGFKSGTHRRKEIVPRIKEYLASMPMNLFCWSYKPSLFTENDFNGWDLYDPFKEYKRMGVDDDSNWRYTECNNEYKLCDTYPKTLVVPESATDEILIGVASYRSRGRIPVLSWLHKNGSSITRCSQPGVGMARKRCKEDEKLVQYIYDANPNHKKNNSKLPIVDARPKANAVANTAMGYGYEIIQHYSNCTLTFCDIENIHVMRNSLNKVRDSIYDDGKWYTGLTMSEWLYHQHLLLTVSNQIADYVHNKCTSVLIHCSDGWDRTAQLVSLAQIILDPYYRTLEGFCILIEKDWITAGHRFSLRHGTDGTTSNERSPIFHQFIECVWQIQQQNPFRFEFNEEFLIDLLDEVYALRFGTFLFDNEKEREDNELKTNTISLWNYIYYNKDKYIIPFFDPLDDVLEFSASDKKIKFWESYYFRHHPKLKPSYTIYDLMKRMKK